MIGPNNIHNIKGFITIEQSKDLIEFIDKQEWDDKSLSRRVQHYGYRYDYKSRNLEKTNPIPEEFSFILKDLNECFTVPISSCIVNEYRPGIDGISPHIDDPKKFSDTIASLSLLSPCLMKFTKDDEAYEYFLAPNSMIIITGEGRYKWKHEISKNKTFIYNDVKYERERRVSVTFR